MIRVRILRGGLLQEALVDRLISQLPDFEEELRYSESNGVQPAGLRWIVKQLKSGQNEKIEEITTLIITFQRMKQRIKSKFGGEATDINTYANTAELRGFLEDVGNSKRKQTTQLKTKETTKVYESEKWVVVMPHTIESSCQWGKGTTWCTAATVSANYFYNYVGDFTKDIVLYYIIRKGGDPRRNPKDKLSVGYVDGKIAPGEWGGMTIDSNQNGMSARDFDITLGREDEDIFEAMDRHQDSIKGKHPAKQEIIGMMREPEEFFNFVTTRLDEDSGEGADSRFLFIENALKYPKVPEKFLESLLYMNFSPSIKQRIKPLVIGHHRISPQTLSDLWNNQTGDGTIALSTLLAKNRKTPVDVLEDIEMFSRKDYNKTLKVLHKRLRSLLIKNENTPLELALDMLTRDGDLASSFVKRTDAPPDILQRIFKDMPRGLRRELADNPNTPLGVLQELIIPEDGWVDSAAATRAYNNLNSRGLAPKLPPRAYDVLLGILPMVDLVNMAISNDTPPLALEKMAQKFPKKGEILVHIARNWNTPLTTLDALKNGIATHYSVEVSDWARRTYKEVKAEMR